MKRLGLFLVLGVLALGTIAFAAGPGAIQPLRWFFKGGISIGDDAEKNRVTQHRFCDVDYDMASVTTTCTDSAAAACSGVKVGDVCHVSFGPRDGGVQIATANLSLSAFSDAVNTVKVRACAAGTAANAADAGYVVECFSSQ